MTLESITAGSSLLDVEPTQAVRGVAVVPMDESERLDKPVLPASGATRQRRDVACGGESD